MFHINVVQNPKHINDRNMSETIRIFNKFKLAVANTFFDFSENIDHNILASTQGFSPSKNNQCMKAFKQRNIIANKENIFIENIIFKLSQISKKKWSKIKNQQKISIYMEIMSGLQIFKKRLPYISTIIHQAQGKSQINQNWIIKQIQNIKSSIENNLYKSKSINQKFKQSNIINQNAISFNNKKNDIQLKQILFQDIQTDNLTRASTGHLCSNSENFMKSYIQNIKSKDGMASTFKKKYNSMQQDQIQQEKISRNMIRSKTAKLNQRTKLKISETRKTIQYSKSSSMIKDLSTSSFYKRNRNYSKKSENNRISEENKQIKMKNQQDKNYDKNYIKNIFGKNRNLNVGAKFDQYQKAKLNQNDKSHFEDKLKVKKNVKIDSPSLEDQQKMQTAKDNKSQSQIKRNYDRSKSKRGKLRKGILSRKRNIKQKSICLSKQNSKYAESCKMIVVECLQNQEEQFQKQIENTSIKGDKVGNYDSESSISQDALISAFQCVQSNVKKQTEKRRKAQKVSPNRLIKRSAILLKPGQFLFPSKQRQLQNQIKSNASVEKTKSIFTQLYELNQQIKKQNQRHANGFSSVLYTQLQKIFTLQQNRSKTMHARRYHSSEINNKQPFNLICQSQLNKAKNIQQCERQYSFMSDADWIRRHMKSPLINQLLQK